MSATTDTLEAGTFAGLEPGLRARLADYHVLEAYHHARACRYGDMAFARRDRELNRLADELLAAGVPFKADEPGRFIAASVLEIRDAWERTVAPRRRRFERSPGAVYGTREARATRDAYNAALAYALNTAAPAPGSAPTAR